MPERRTRLAPLPPERLRVNEEVVWHYVPRGGWGVGMYVDARIVRVGPKRVTIRAQKTNGTFAETSVEPTSLRDPHKTVETDLYGNIIEDSANA